MNMKNEEIKISIIVPIYNAEKYIERNLESLINQSLKEVEIILINDGSTDNSLEICNRYAALDKRITIIDKVNEGVSIARNKGLEVAKGEYIGFVDADDYIESEMYEKMYNRVVCSQSDMCVCNYFINTQNTIVRISNNLDTILIKDREIKENFIKPMIAPKDIGETEGILGFRGPVMYLYKRSVIKENKIKFDKNLVIGEDFLFNLIYINKINKIAVERNYYYHYCINNDSAITRYRENWWEIHRYLILKIEECLKSNKLDEKFRKRLNVMKINYLIGAIVNETHPNNKKLYKQKIETLKTIFKDDIIKQSLINYTYKQSDIKRKVWAKLIKNNNIRSLYWYYKVKAKIRQSWRS